MKKGLWFATVILGISAIGAGYFSGSEVNNSASGKPTIDLSIRQYSRSPQVYRPNEDESYFYDRLAPYGNWIDLDPYGYVWVPRNTGYRWRPYSDGQWAWTDYGWTWISDQEWGDIPFHYGRWGLDDSIGWFWVPGTVWGPAWVTWRSNDQYLGWAPLPPGAEFRAGMDFNSRSYEIPLDSWIFIQGPHFQDRDLNPYVLPFERNRTIINFTSIHNNIHISNDRIINEGIGFDEVRRITGRGVLRYRTQETREPGRAKVVGSDVLLFRPEIRQNKAAKPKTYWNRDQARSELKTARVFDPRGRQAIDLEAAAVQRRQAEELKLLELSQAQEIRNMQEKRVQEEGRIRNASEKAKVTRSYEAKISDLKKNHAVEKQQMTDRHKNDAEHVKKVAQTPPNKKK